jgi:hypothetical protein
MHGYLTSVTLLPHIRPPASSRISVVTAVNATADAVEATKQYPRPYTTMAHAYVCSAPNTRHPAAGCLNIQQSGLMALQVHAHYLTSVSLLPHIKPPLASSLISVASAVDATADETEATKHHLKPYTTH